MHKVTRLGDICDHGAVVITASQTSTVDGIPRARIGDLVACPIPNHGINPIVAQLGSTTTTDGRKQSHVTSITACGAMLVTGSPTQSNETKMG